MSSYFCVYELVNSIDNKVFYVGKGKKYRPENHVYTALRGGKYYVHRKIRKIIAQGGKIKIRRVFETTEEQEALNEEIRLIAFYGFKNLTNMTEGGEGSSGFRHSEDSIELMKQKQRGKKLTPESIAKREATRKERGVQAWNKGMKMSKEFCEKVGRSGLGKIPWNKGKKMSQSFREKISRASKGHKMTEENKRKITEIAKRPKSEEHRRKISESKKGKPIPREVVEKIAQKNRGRKHSDVWRQHQSESLKGRKFSEEHKAKLRKPKGEAHSTRMSIRFSKQTICIETGQMFKSAVEAGAANSVTPEAIRNAIYFGSKSCGFHWRHANE